MSTKRYPKIIFALAMAAGLVGCASSGHHRVAVLSLEDVNNYRVDCSRRDEQLEFLRTQIKVLQTVSYSDAGYMATGVGQLAGGTRERALRTRGYHRAVIYEKINYLNLNC
jgi:hypothetical protein